MTPENKEMSEEFAQWAEQSKEFAGNLAQATELSQRIWTRFIDKGLSNDKPIHFDPLNTMPAFMELGQAMMDNPQDVAEATMQFWAGQAELWRNTTLRWLGGDEDAPRIEPKRGDKRFNHKEWSENAVFDYLKQSYLLTSGWLQNTVNHVGDMDERDRKKVEFYTRTFVEALSPSNFFGLNPEVLETTMDQKGQNLVRGLQMMLEDVDRGKGTLLIRQTDMDAFEVGRDMAVTPGKVIYQNRLFQLIQYSPATEKVYSRPFLFVPPWINKYYVVDLNPKKSMMKWLVEQGYTVFLVSWTNPDESAKGETWETYLTDGVSHAIDKVLEETGQKSLNIASYCIGGTMVGTALAYFGKTGDTRVNSATFFTAQMDFTDAGELQVFVDDQTICVVDEQMMEKGYLPAEAMATAFNMLRSADLIWGYVINNYYLGKEPFPFDLLYWNSDSTAMPAAVHHFYLEEFYTKNAFSTGELPVLGEKIGKEDIKVPVYHLAAKEDHIAPPESVYRGARKMTGADVRFVLGGSGHIAGVVNPPAAGKYQYWINEDLSPEDLSEWQAKATEYPGSWWVDWNKWLAKKSGRKIEAETREAGKTLGVVEDAPGSYVKVRFDQR